MWRWSVLASGGGLLFEQMRNIPGIRIQAVCDIWPYARGKGQVWVGRHQGERPPGYVDLDEMLEKEKDLHCAIIATPDFWHAPHAIRCMEAGLHVYCESMMAHTLDAAREIVRASERTGKLCQIGHQHRSGAIYQFIRDRLLHQHEICGPIHHINSQWNIPLNVMHDIMANPRVLPEQELINRYGFPNAQAFLNWRQYPAFSCGWLENLSARQLDIMRWMVKDATPRSVFVSAGRDFFRERESFDNLMCVIEYDTPHGSIRAFHQSLSSINDPEIREEKFIGPDATLRLAGAGELVQIRNRTSDDASGQKLMDLARRGYIRRSAKLPCYLEQENEDSEIGLLSHESTPPIPYELPGKSRRPAIQAHLANFFEAIHGRAVLNCDARTAYVSELPIHLMRAAAEAGVPQRIDAEAFEV